MKKLLSPGATVRKLSDVARRFPLAVVFVAVIAALTLLAVHGFEDEINYRWWVFTGIALFAAVAAALAVERRWSWTGGLLAGAGVAALWGVRCLFFPADPDELTSPQMVEIGVISGATFLAAFFSPFLRRGTDVRWWNFSVRLLLRLILGSIFSGILFGGFALAMHAVSELFDVNPPDEIFAWLAVACFIVFAPLYVMAGIPAGEEKCDDEARPLHVLKVLALFILGPILAAYTLILYFYLLKIVVTWELPNGWVSWLVTALGSGGLVVALLLYPLRMKDGDRLVELISRWTGVVIAPLLILMTVGIARRISDYGLTPNRCYILLLNLWFYCIYAYLFLTRGRRVKWILVSAVAVAVLSSVGPWSLARITPRPAAVDEFGAEQEEEEYGEWFSSKNTVDINRSYALEGEYGNFTEIHWNDNDSYNGYISLTGASGDLVIGLYAGESAGEADAERGDPVREFRLPLAQAARDSIVRGEDFVFLVGECYGRRYETAGEADHRTRDSIRVTYLEGYLLHK